MLLKPSEANCRLTPFFDKKRSDGNSKGLSALHQQDPWHKHGEEVATCKSGLRMHLFTLVFACGFSALWYSLWFHHYFAYHFVRTHHIPSQNVCMCPLFLQCFFWKKHMFDWPIFDTFIGAKFWEWGPGLTRCKGQHIGKCRIGQLS